MRRSRVQISLWALFFGARFLGTEDRNLAVQDRNGERANELKRARGACLACLACSLIVQRGFEALYWKPKWRQRNSTAGSCLPRQGKRKGKNGTGGQSG